MEEERCCICDEPTSRAGIADDSLFGDNGDGPYCENCFEWKYGVIANNQEFKSGKTA